MLNVFTKITKRPKLDKANITVLLINIHVYRILAKESDKLYKILSAICRFHVYRDNWGPVLDKVLLHQRETLKTQDL